MSNPIRNLHVALWSALLLASSSPAAAQAPIWSQPVGTTFSDWGPSQTGDDAGGRLDAEVADDFDLTGTVERVEVRGYNAANAGLPAGAFRGVHVRFYAAQETGGPQALLDEQYVAADSPALWIDDTNPNVFRVTLARPFQASGRHFVSVQPDMDVVSNARWFWRSANEGQPRGTALWRRDNTVAAAEWTHAFDSGTATSDASFTLWGTASAAQPLLSSVSAAKVARSDRFHLLGSGFGVVQGASTVSVGGRTAPVTRWSDTEITAYVPESAAMGAALAQVTTAGGASNALALTVTARPAAVGRVPWRFRADGLYIMGRPAVGPDGTVYTADVNGHLYALAPNGGLKWVFRIETGNVVSSVDVGPDGTVYVAGGNVVYAVRPDGTRRWSVADPSFGSIFFGPNVGPDGKVYAVSDDGGRGLGAFAISPDGAVVWSRPGFLRRGNTGLNREIVFDATQLYFSANNIDGTSGLRGLSLASGAQRFLAAGSSQPAVTPGGLVWTQTSNLNGVSGGLAAYRADGSVFFRSDTAGLSTQPQTGPDGSVYFGHGLSAWKALEPSGKSRWRVVRTNRVVQVPCRNPRKAIVVAGEYVIGSFGFVQGLRATDGVVLWSLKLPAENGNFVRTMSPTRFSLDGRYAYVGMDVNDGAADPYTYLYAIDVK
jgi:hypothetical protein